MKPTDTITIEMTREEANALADAMHHDMRREMSVVERNAAQRGLSILRRAAFCDGETIEPAERSYCPVLSGEK